jgi:hypothetical protein
VFVCFVLDNRGNVGIGTDSPTRTVEIGTDGGGEKILKMHSDTASSYFEIQSIGNVARLLATNNTNLLLQSDGGGGYITFNANSAERMRITPSGNVGIGTTTPITKLEVASSGANGIDISADAGNSLLSGRLFLSTGTTGQSVSMLNNAGDLTFRTQATPNNTSGNERVRVGSNGNVGIGTTNVNNNRLSVGRTLSNNAGIGHLQLVGTDIGNQAVFRIDTSGTLHIDQNNGANMYANLSIQRTGNVGIGTTAPTKTLDVRGSSLISGSFSGADANALTLVNTDSSGNPSILRMVFSGEGGNEALQIGMYSSPAIKPVYFQSTQGSGWGNIVFQKNGGNVGIGTDSPTQKLHVNGNVSASLYYGDGENLTNVQRIPKVEYLELTSNVSTNDELTLPNGLEYTLSANGYEYLEVFMDGIRLNRTLDYAEVDPTSVRYLLNVPSGSVITYKSLTLV